MTEAPKSQTLLKRIVRRLRVTSVAQALLASTSVVLVLAVIAVLANRLFGLVPQADHQPEWLLAIPALAFLGAFLFHRRIEQQTAARALDQHAQTHDLFLTLNSLDTSAGEYQPLVTLSAESIAERYDASDVVPFSVDKRIAIPVGLVAVLAALFAFMPQVDLLGRVEAASRVEKEKKEIEAIRSHAIRRKDRLEKEAKRAAEEAEEIANEIEKLKQDFRRMEPRKVESNAKVLDQHRMELADLWKAAASNEQLRRMMNEPISQKQLGSRSQKMNDWLKELQDGRTDKLQQALAKAQKKLEQMMKADTPEEREKLAQELQKELQDLQRFAKDKAGSRELNDALSKALKSLQTAKKAGQNSEQSADQLELSKEAMQALKESLELSEKEMEQLAQSAKDLKKLEEALKTLQKAQQANQQEKLDGSKCEGCESLEDYEKLYAQLMGQGAGDGGEKDLNSGDGGGAGRGGTTPEDDSDPEGYKTEKERPRIKAGKVLLSIKTKEYAGEKDFDPEEMRKYRDTITELKSSVQSAIETEEIPPGYVEGIKGYFDKIENVAPQLKSE